MTLTKRALRFGRNHAARVIIRIVMYILLIDLAFIFIFPFLYMIVNSVKTNTDLYDPTINWVPRTLDWMNYTMANRILSYSTYIWNSVLITVGPTIGHLVSCSFIGYGFARYNFKGKKFFFFMVIVALVVPVQTLIIPQYMMYNTLGWKTTMLPFYVPSFLGLGLKGALYIYLFTQYFKGLPKELEEAAYVDGCGYIRTFIRIVLPMAQSIFIVTVVLSIVWHWNDFYEPSIYLNRPGYGVLPSRLQTIIDFVNNPPAAYKDAMGEMLNPINNAVLLAGTTMVIAPVVIVFGFLQRSFIQGIERAGLTGE